MSDEDLSQVLLDRRRKLEGLRAAGIDPFPHAYPGVQPIADVKAPFADLPDGEETDVRARIAGRLAARRGQGKAAFLDVVDRSGRMQLHARVDVLGAEAMERLLALDLGDLIGADGTVFRTRRGELSLRVDDFALLAKSLRPPPDKHHGLADVETRHRHRELDLIASEEARALFITRAKVIAAVRRFLDDAGFVEVETPILQPLYGGAAARPFVTHHNQLDRDLYLRIATELYLKRLIVGGLERVYELGKDFRNEGVSFKHNPEFTVLEWYEAYADYDDVARRCEALVASVAEAVGYEGELDFSTPWRRETLAGAIDARAGVDILANRDLESLRAAMRARGHEVPENETTWGQLVDHLLSKYVEPELIQPTFLTDYPVEISPLAKRHRSEPGLTERWEAFAAGMEFANAFTELNDPDDQRARFEDQRNNAAEGDEEAHPVDEAYLAALEQGMPPTGGIGIGIDRLVMLLTGQRSIREVVLFPAMR
ncbi:MAG: lysine--tRNA ligase [Solirubrobacteraceae bacterium]